MIGIRWIKLLPVAEKGKTKGKQRENKGNIYVARL
jgi:hypothetical protein